MKIKTRHQGRFVALEQKWFERFVSLDWKVCIFIIAVTIFARRKFNRACLALRFFRIEKFSNSRSVHLLSIPFSLFFCLSFFQYWKFEPKKPKEITFYTYSFSRFTDVRIVNRQTLYIMFTSLYHTRRRSWERASRRTLKNRYKYFFFSVHSTQDAEKYCPWHIKPSSLYPRS